MSLRINGISGRYSIPNVLSQKYKYTAFQPTMTFRVTSPDGKTEDKQVDVKRTIEEAWRFVTNRAAIHKPCNDYFKTLARGKTLKEVLDEGDITLHCLTPKEGRTLDDVPDANTAGRDIGIHPALLVGTAQTPSELSATLIHELAHVAGATTNPRDQNAIAAEKALQSCLCARHFRPEAVGFNEQIELKTRMV